MPQVLSPGRRPAGSDWALWQRKSRHVFQWLSETHTRAAGCSLILLFFPASPPQGRLWLLLALVVLPVVLVCLPPSWSSLEAILLCPNSKFRCWSSACSGKIEKTPISKTISVTSSMNNKVRKCFILNNKFWCFHPFPKWKGLLFSKYWFFNKEYSAVPRKCSCRVIRVYCVYSEACEDLCSDQQLQHTESFETDCL